MCNKMQPLTLGLLICFFGNSLLTMANPPNLTRSISQFSNDLYAVVTEGESSNVILSPFSIHMAVSLAMMGARGRTYDEMLRGLKLSGTNEDIAEAIHRLLIPIEYNADLKVANKVYVMQNYRINPQFNEIAKEKFHSETESLNFANSHTSAGVINQWVEDKTNNKIKNLIQPDSLGTDTRMVLVNAIYFKGLWQYQFLKERTKKERFYTSETNSVFVDMMHVKESFRYGEFAHLDAKGIELPYKDSDMVMFIILPNARNGLAKLEADLKHVDLGELSSRYMYRTEVDVALPKFKIEFEVSLVDALKKMGMGKMFSNAADFSGLLETNEPLQVSDVVHKAFIDVNEEGVEAAAATGMLLIGRSARVERSIPFVANRGFIYAIISKSAGSILIGRKSF